ncbi:MAG: BlaI/MecI/CopY family transcriptional regulator [Candidatus Aminicenantes bacterium]|jgi:predicted transcriptional regulator
MKNAFSELSKRERQILDIVYSKCEASASEIRDALSEDLSNSGVRTILRSMLRKGVLKYKEKDLKYVYYPTIPREKAQLSALQHIKKTLFQDSPEGVLTALLKGSEISEKDLDRLEALIKKAREEGK